MRLIFPACEGDVWGSGLLLQLHALQRDRDEKRKKRKERKEGRKEGRKEARKKRRKEV